MFVKFATAESPSTWLGARGEDFLLWRSYVAEPVPMGQTAQQKTLNDMSAVRPRRMRDVSKETE
ncbi:MAG: hypothetical protein COV91_03040 [Candidatus Taylorbacteria bacterium CG11_big_fil_rev_8_21_14_0_20_46_11]|uniref:Uncharacterized protein n=1 Tax=Candidatus Taylorbacteria bacterium CG11_big_fil_rev_8_21_14_0_20_46_11 TaxID=1975025 RepID=A0A2H0KBL2_9BACT|nr:MAG: hypothetical protein COV91_03040 [Candidatus Taylorbacteria bacterium CG11_big_fil_rev_8_21_14_0_20_46_11]